MTANELFDKWWDEFDFTNKHANDMCKEGAIETAARFAYIEGYYKALFEEYKARDYKQGEQDGQINNKSE